MDIPFLEKNSVAWPSPCLGLQTTPATKCICLAAESSADSQSNARLINPNINIALMANICYLKREICLMLLYKYIDRYKGHGLISGQTDLI
jgi:hypothetical protein